MVYVEKRIKNILANLRVVEDWMELERKLVDRDWDRFMKYVEIQQVMFKNLGEDIWIAELSLIKY